MITSFSELGDSKGNAAHSGVLGLRLWAYHGYIDVTLKAMAAGDGHLIAGLSLAV